MKVRFHIHYHTRWGEQIAVSGNCPALGNGSPGAALIMTHTGDGHWTAEAEIEAPASLSYSYLLMCDGVSLPVRTEWGLPRTIALQGSRCRSKTGGTTVRPTPRSTPRCCATSSTGVRHTPATTWRATSP